MFFLISRKIYFDEKKIEMFKRFKKKKKNLRENFFFFFMRKIFLLENFEIKVFL